MNKKDILIFGVGAAGRAIHKSLSKNDKYRVVGFIDNNINLVGTKYLDTSIYSVQDLSQIEFDFIAIGGVWADEMLNQLLKSQISKDRILMIEEKDICFNSEKREILTDECLKILDKFLTKNKIPYFIDGSSMLCLLRGKSLSSVSDVDIAMLEYRHLKLLSTELYHLFPNFDIKIIKFENDDLIRKSEDIFKIVLTSSDDDKIVLDINIYDGFKNLYVLGYNGRYFYFPKYMANEFKRIKYKDFSLSILKDYDTYARFVYGDDYIKIPKHFYANDYLNLVTKDELLNIALKY